MHIIVPRLKTAVITRGIAQQQALSGISRASPATTYVRGNVRIVIVVIDWLLPMCDDTTMLIAGGRIEKQRINENDPSP